MERVGPYAVVGLLGRVVPIHEVGAGPAAWVEARARLAPLRRPQDNGGGVGPRRALAEALRRLGRASEAAALDEEVQALLRGEAVPPHGR